MRQAHHLTVRGIGRQDVGPHSTDIFCQRHDQFLTNGVDGWVCDLRKLLTEIVEEHLWTVADNGQRRVVTHGSHGFLTSSSHWHDGLVDILLTVAKLHQLLLQVTHTVLYMTTALQFLQLYTILAEPFTVGMGLGQLLFNLTVVIDLAFLRIYQQNLSRLQTPFRYDIAWLEVHHAYL